MHWLHDVSNPEVAGRTIDELNTEDKGFIIARVRKGDSDVVPAPDAARV